MSPNSPNSDSGNVSPPPLPLGGRNSMTCEHGSFSGHRHCSNSDMIDMFNHLGCSPTILGIAGHMGQRTHGGGVVDDEWVWDQWKRREDVKRTGS